MKVKLLKKLRAKARDEYRLKYSNGKYRILLKLDSCGSRFCISSYYCEGLAIKNVLKWRREYVLEQVAMLRKIKFDKANNNQKRYLEDSINKRLKKWN